MPDIQAKKIKCFCGCGNNLKPNYIRDRVKSANLHGWMVDGKIIGISGYGYLDNGFFNTLRCGFNYAVNIQTKLKCKDKK